MTTIPGIKTKGHYWVFLGWEDVSTWEPENKKWARKRYTCIKCQNDTMVGSWIYPNQWAVNEHWCRRFWKR